MNLLGVQDILTEANKYVTPREVEQDNNLEIEDHSTEAWEQIPLDSGLNNDTFEKLESFVKNISVEVSVGTDACYRRYMRHFDLWLEKSGHIPPNSSIFSDDLPKWTPVMIVAWIMSLCDGVNPDGEQKAPQDTQRTYTHAMKLRSSLTYGFGRHYNRGNKEWAFNSDTDRWEGNPSVSTQVGRYMISLKKRKFSAGDRSAMSSRAITSDIIRRVYAFNQKFTNNEPMTADPKVWGGRRKRLLVHAVMTVAFVCLMRIDEVLNLRFEDVQVLASNRLVITLESRKTHQYGGSKPYYLWRFADELLPLCPVTALAAWIAESRLSNCTGYIFRSPAGEKPPSSIVNKHITSAAYLELFRNNLVDVGIDPTMYGGHSFRRGGCQWLVRELGWSILRVCDWGGWSKDFNHSSIIKYLFSWNDDPYEPREDFFKPDNSPCPACRRSCSCN